MSRSGDHVDDMANDSLSDEVIETFFLGKPGWDRDEHLAQLAGHMAVATAGPDPVPDHNLLQLFWAGEAPAVERRRRPVRAVLAAAIGSATLFVGVGAAGAAGVLPGPVQQAVAKAVAAVTPFELPRAQDVRPSGVPGRGPAVTAPGSSSTSVAPSAPSTTPSGQQLPPTGPGATGTDRARQTPAADAIPPQVPQTPAGPPSGLPAGPPATPPTTGPPRAGQVPPVPTLPSTVPAAGRATVRP